MSFKKYSKQLDKAITRLSGSLDLEEAFYIEDDAAQLKSLVVEVQNHLQKDSKIIKLADFPFKIQCQILLSEAFFYLKEAEEFFS